MTDASPVLAATDFSEMSRWAAERAGRLSRQWGRDVVLTHVLPRSSLDRLREWLGPVRAPEDHLVDKEQRALQQAAADLEERLGVTIIPRICTGSPPDALALQADTLTAKLIVVGARGASTLRRLTLGTTAERLLRRTTHPVLVVRQPVGERYQRVGVAVDFSDWSRAAVALAREVAPTTPLFLIAVFEVPFQEKLRFAGVDSAMIDHYRRQARLQATQRLHALAHDCGLKPDEWRACVAEGDASQRIVEQLAAQRCDLAVLGKHGQSVAEDLLLGSVTMHVLAESASDVLVSTARATR